MDAASSCPKCGADPRMVEHLGFHVHQWTNVITDHFTCKACSHDWKVVTEPAVKSGRRRA